MKIFFTSVSHGKLGRLLNDIYMSMQRVLNHHLGEKNYGSGLQEWFLLFAMLPPDLPGYDSPERVRYEKKNRAMDLRLHVSNEAFRQADEGGRKALVVECMMRSLDLIAAKKIPDFDIAALRADVFAIAREQGWIGDASG